MNIGFDGQTVVVTGAARGIGRSIARGFAERGAHVYACDIREDELQEATESLDSSAGGTVTARVVDVCDRAAVGALIADAAGARPGRGVDVVVHAAGGILGQVKQPLSAVTPEQWHSIIDVNVTGAFYLAQAAAPAMVEAKRGRIIVISSRAAFSTSLTGIHSYAAAKAGQLGLIRQLALELGPSGITVNGIAPGFMRTNPDAERQWEAGGSQGQEDMIRRLAVRRLGKPEDITHAAMFIASDYAEWMTGQTIQIYGAP